MDFSSDTVLKPPGGVSSDIFGANGEQMMEARRNKNLNQTSTLFLGGHDDDHHSKGSCKSGNGSHQRLFGDDDTPIPRTPYSRDRMKSSIVLDENDVSNANTTNTNETNILVVDITPDDNADLDVEDGLPINWPSTPDYELKETRRGAPFSPRNPVTGFGFVETTLRQTNYGRRKDGNPVTGEGYDAAPLKPQTAQTLSGGTTPSTPNSSTGSAAPRQRVPPGGFSSGLW